MPSPSAVSIKLSGLNELYSRLGPKKVTASARAAIGRTIASTHTESKRIVTNYWNISQKNLSTTATGLRRIETTGYVRDDLSGEITFWSGGISLVYFGASEFRLTAARSKKTAKRMGESYSKGSKALVGIRVQTQKGGRTALLRQFFATMSSGHKGVFRRDPRGGKTRNGNAKIIESSAVGITTMIMQPKVYNKLKAHIYQTFKERMTHELKRRGVVD